MNPHVVQRHWSGVKYKVLSSMVALSLFGGVLPQPGGVAHAAPLSQGEATPVVASAVTEVEACTGAPMLSASGIEQNRSLLSAPGGDQQWMKLTVKQDTHYRLQVNTSTPFQADLFGDCAANTQGQALRAGSLEFTPLTDRTLYVRVKSSDAAKTMDYGLSLTSAAADEKTIPLAQVPVEYHRRAETFLDQMRNSPLAEKWDSSARLADTVRLVYRPDMQTPAYYEFPVEHKEATGQFAPAGFIQVAAGQHDYPITHWNVDGQSPTQALDEEAPLSGNTTKYYKLDALSYVAEYEEFSPSIFSSVVATDVLQLGALPPKIEGMDQLSLADEQALHEVNSKPVGAPSLDDNNPVSMTLELQGPEEPASLSNEPWSSWSALKQGYTETYGILLDRLSVDAQDEWKQEQNAATYGEGLVKGDVRTVQGLETLTLSSINVSGAGADAAYLSQEMLNNGSTPVGVKLTVLDQPSTDKGLPVDVLLSYTNGVTESVKYVVSALAKSNVYLPVISGPESKLASANTQATTAINGSWGPWSYWWAGVESDQRLYDQIAANTFNNNFPCWSGCGATAWAMLFGWADHQATLGNAAWSGRFGIYRQDGGFGADADAPRFMDGGIRNIMMEIRGYIKTYCNSGGGWTQSSDMGEAYRYLQGRTGTRLHSLYSNGWWIFGTTEDDVRNRAISVIQSGRPVVIGRDSHFPLAWGYAQQSRQNCFLFFCSTEYNRWFYVNQGWGGSSNGWVTANAWFAGDITPN